jgi:hypothetical protein
LSFSEIRRAGTGSKHTGQRDSVFSFKTFITGLFLDKFYFTCPENERTDPILKFLKMANFFDLFPGILNRCRILSSSESNNPDIGTPSGQLPFEATGDSHLLNQPEIPEYGYSGW